MTMYHYFADGKRVGPFESPFIALDAAFSAGVISQDEHDKMSAELLRQEEEEDMAEDPSVSEAQHNAMEAAAHGKSTLGIPRKVGEEFVAKDANGHAAGVMFVAPDGDVLLMKRSAKDADRPGVWALPGGRGEDGEEPLQTALREAHEETGFAHSGKGAKVLDQRMTPTGMAFHTFAHPVSSKFAPMLNEEHDEYKWAGLHDLPHPLHPGVAATLKDRLLPEQGATDMSSEEWDALRSGFAKWTREEEAEAEHSDKKAQDSKHRVALDKKSVRSYDQDGHLLVEMTPISKANVCPYRGEEIPGAEEMGLDLDKTYMLLRDPEELAKAAPTAQGKPLLLVHIPVSADDHPREITVGSVAGEAEFKAPYLMAPLSVWDGEAIKLIESDKQRELSCAYHYDCDLTPGDYEGEHYDGVMRNIKFNHVALVEEGRAGPDVIVGDSKLKEKDMSGSKTALSAAGAVAYGALMTHLRPKLAKDAKIDLKPALAGLTKKNFKDRKKKLVGDVALAVKGKLAKDASLDDVTEFLDCLEKEVDGEDALEPNAGTAMAGQVRGSDEEDPKRKFLQEKLSAEDMKAYDDMNESEAMDEETEEERKKKEAEDAEEKEPKVMDKKAMDAAISGAVGKAVAMERKRNHEINEAREFVTPWVGKISLACDSAPAVFKAALGILKVDVNGVHDDALKHVLAVQPKPNETRHSFAADARTTSVAQDAAPAGYGFTDMFPAAKPTAHV